ncbi:acyl-CoA dehydrogenase family protein [Nocardia veterana]|uniref:Acyl-CoA/acyl-ACP dehydrogenase n=1 Tax=Nocardia veterana TaxID=132249 RepID=A0A7X6M0Q8_9NOCA|nr:acyl-CoA dehydrogenase family protein [Nocardia veterana]NKY87614.1 acyl-CoA/acyl-ACP dehydrogenase [Nocardia veterana]
MGIDAQERDALAEAVREAASSGPREFLDDRGNPARDVRLWKVLTEQMGLAGLLIPEEDGGAGAGIAELSVVLEQLARALAVVPALSSLGAAASLLRLTGTPTATALANRLASEGLCATVAWADPSSHTAAPLLAADGQPGEGAEVTVSGRAEFVLDGANADVILFPARYGDSDVVVSVSTSAPSVRREAMPGLDLTRGLASVSLDNASATVLGDVNLQAALDVTQVLISAEQVGIAQHCHDAAVAWAKERIQFDRPIGQFQAIKHQLVDLLMAVELARSSHDVAVAAADAYLAAPSESAARALGVAASAAAARCGDAAARVADESLHIFGGIGFTWEHDAHLYLRRAKVLETLFGSPAAHRARFASTLLEEAANG